MLPADLLVARIWRGRLYPAFSRLREEELYVASAVVEAFEDHVGRTLGELRARLAELERLAFEAGCHYKLVRGLAHLLFRRAELKPPETSVNPVRARLEVFRAAAELGGYALTEEERRRAFEVAAERLGVVAGEVARAFEAAYEENRVLASFERVAPKQLLREYNLSLAQTVLFRALGVKARVRASGGEVKILLRNAKRLGLMYWAYEEGGYLVLELDGPASLLRQTERYGTKLAKLLPSIAALREWLVEARVRVGKRTALFKMSSRGAPPLPKLELRLEPYDSSVEEDFYRRFSRAGSGWRVLREPDPLVAGGRVFIPDFAFEKEGVKVYMEIVGFWTLGYLRRKVEKLRALRGVAMIVAVDQELACSPEAAGIPQEVIVYRRRVPVDEVYRALKRYEPRQPRRRAEEYRPSPAVLSYLSQVREERLSRVLEGLAELGLKPAEALRAIEAAGLEVEWRSLDPRDAVVKRPAHLESGEKR